MNMNIKVDTESFLNENPDLYQAIYPYENKLMAKFVEHLLKRYISGNSVLDIGSGLGREVAYLTGKGYDVLGIDNCIEMIEFSKNKYKNESFYLADQRSFEFDKKFDAIFSVGSTFLYNFTDENILGTLNHFNKHLKREGIIYLDMRNPCFFMTPEGQSWISKDIIEETLLEGQFFKIVTQYNINFKEQKLIRDYQYYINDVYMKEERLYHRLIFLQEIIHYLNCSGFQIIMIFDEPAPHIGIFDDNQTFKYKATLKGRRMQLVAKKISGGERLERKKSAR